MVDTLSMIESETKKILIIEDEFPMRYLIEHQLKQNGFEVNLAKDGPTGLKAIDLDKPDLVLLDVMMPGMDGFDVCTAIKNNPETADIPVIFVTASEVDEYRRRAYDVGAAEYMTKPFSPEELISQISAAINRKKLLYSDIEPDQEELWLESAETDIEATNRIVTLFSPKGGVGTTTLSVHLAEAVALEVKKPVVLIDLDLPFGGIAPMLDIFPSHDILELLSIHADYITLSVIDEFAQCHLENVFIIPAPGRLIDPDKKPDFETFQTILKVLTEEGYDVIIDAGSHLTPFTKQVLLESDMIYLVTSGEMKCNRLTDAFIKYADEIGLDSRKIMPVINEVHGPIKDVTLMRVPVARIPSSEKATENSLFLKEQGLRKLVSLLH